MRGAREHEREYLLELHTEIRTYARVDCDGIPNVILGKVSEIFSRTCWGIAREFYVKKGGNTWYITMK